MNEKHALPAYLLWFFLGWFGIHKFYLGKTVWGIAFTFSPVAFFLVGWFIDLFTIPEPSAPIQSTVGCLALRFAATNCLRVDRSAATSVTPK